jgi:hypothetical protein
MLFCQHHWLIWLFPIDKAGGDEGHLWVEGRGVSSINISTVNLFNLPCVMVINAPLFLVLRLASVTLFMQLPQRYHNIDQDHTSSSLFDVFSTRCSSQIPMSARGHICVILTVVQLRLQKASDDRADGSR